MTTTESAKTVLTWTSSKEWGSIGNTYSAEANGWSYCANQPSKGRWGLRGWGPNGLFLYRDGGTLKEMKQAAENHQADLTATAAEAAPVMADLAPAATRAFGKIVSTISAGMLDLTSAGNRFLLSSVYMDGQDDSLWRALRPAYCRCATPTHTMRCGAGGRVMTVLPKPRVLLSDEGAALYSDADEPADDECIDAYGTWYAEHDYNDIECRRCGAEAGA